MLATAQQSQHFFCMPPVLGLTKHTPHDVRNRITGDYDRLPRNLWDYVSCFLKSQAGH
jgi:hypothetical protein